MSDLIERDKAIEAIRSHIKDIDGDDDALDYIATNMLKDVPSARPNGENLCKEYPTLFECSLCGASCDDTVSWDCDINFCPNCGADMRERENER